MCWLCDCHSLVHTHFFPIASAAEVISSREAELIELISNAYGEHFDPHKIIFNDFFNYLAEIPRTLDMCALKEEVHKVLFKVYKVTIVTASEDYTLLYQPQAYQSCLYNFFLANNNVDIQRFYKIFEKNFARFWYFMRSRKILIDVLNAMVKHVQFSNSCNTALLHATDCARCSGYRNVQVCNNFCINLFRGCLIDFQEVGVAYDNLYSVLKSLEYQVANTFNPDVAFRSFHFGFLTFTTKIIGISTPPKKNIPPIIIQRVCIHVFIIVNICGYY